MFTEVADRVWVARTAWLDVNVSVIGGETGLVVVDTLGSEEAIQEVIPHIQQLGEVVGVVNTHDHFDHTWGNAAITRTWPDAWVTAHEGAAAQMDTAVTSFALAKMVNLGDRALELFHPGPAHTGGDIVVRVGDANVVLMGDLIEESAPPSFGEDSFPLEWPVALDIVRPLLNTDTVLVPGHGAVCDFEFFMDQRADLITVAETIRDCAQRGRSEEQALAESEWPWPREHLAEAVRRGYASLPPGGKQLPML